jgi:amino acid adenylation domain-containing protein
MDQLAIVSEFYTKEREYWVHKLQGEWHKCTFAGGESSGNKKGKMICSQAFKIPGDIYSRMMKLTRGSEAKLHMVVTAAVIILLHKYTGNRDILVGMPIYRQEVESPLINTVLTLRNRIAVDSTFKEILLQVRQTIADADAHRNYPFEMLLDSLKIPYAPGDDFPLFDVTVLMENIHDKSYLDQVPHNFTFSIVKKAEQIEGEVVFNSLRCKQETVKRLIEYLHHLLRQVLFNVDLAVKEMEILTSKEKELILTEFNDTRTVYPRGKKIHRLFEEQVAKTPGNTAIMSPGGNETQLTYLQLNKEANRLANVLRRKGVGPGSIVGIMAESSRDTLAVILAILKAGGAYLPIQPDAPVNRIVSMLDSSNVRLLLTQAETGKIDFFTALQGLQAANITPHRTASRPRFTNLDSLPIPDRSLIDYEKYHKYIGLAAVKNRITLQATRGCPYKCAYCSKIWPKQHSVRSARHLFDEVKLYYHMGVRRFDFVDDIFNLEKKNSEEFFRLIIENRMNKDIRLLFPAGLRGDILTKDFIDLMIEAGTINIALALETASPRLQKLVKKFLDIEKLHENMEYITRKYPHVLLELFTMHGFPTETEEEARKTLDFIKSLKWIHFPYVHILKIYGNTEMEKLALESGISLQSIIKSQNLAWHELPDTLPFKKQFTLRYQAEFLNDYFLSRERLLHVLPYQMKLLTEDEMVQKYNSYLPVNVTDFPGLLQALEIKEDELDTRGCLDEESIRVVNLNEKTKQHFQLTEPGKDALNVLFLDLSQHFSMDNQAHYDPIEPPLGLMYVMTYLKRRFGSKINGKIAKPVVDFNSYDRLNTLLKEFKPAVIGIRSLSYYQDFFHKTAALIRQWGIDVPIIAGGPYATSDYHTMLKDRNVNLAVIGEGEAAFAQLIDKIVENRGKMPREKVLKQIPGIAFVEKENQAHKQFAREIFSLEALSKTAAGEPGENHEPSGRGEDLAYVMFTSGSTGKPNGVMVEHSQVNNCIYWMQDTFKLSETDRIVQRTNLTFDPSVWEIFWPLAIGAGIKLITREQAQDADFLIHLLAGKNPYTLMYCPSSLVKAMVYILNMLPGKPRLKLPWLIIGAEPIKMEVVKMLYSYLDGKIVNTYGPTECTINNTYYPLDPDDNRSIVPIGKPVANNHIFILSGELQLLPVSIPGEICIAGDSVARGYINNPGKTVERFIPNPFAPGRFYKTGDIGRWLEDGTIEILGRKDQQVKIRGFRIELHEIELALIKHKDISETIVLPFKDDPRQGHSAGNPTAGENSLDYQYLCAYFVAETKPSVTELKDFLSAYLPQHMIPSYFVPLEAMPVTHNGKIDRKALAAIKTGPGRDTGYIAPRTNLEKSIGEIWKEILNIDRVGIHDNLFDIGGNSITAMLIGSRLKMMSGEDISVVTVFKYPTIHAMVGYLKNKDQEEDNQEIPDSEFHQSLTVLKNTIRYVQQEKNE